MEPRIVNQQEFVGKTVGRRRPPSALEASGTLQQTVRDLMAACGHRFVPRGVYKFTSHEEADAWMQRMTRPRKS